MKNSVLQRPDQTGVALLQARHVLNDMEDSELRQLVNGFPEHDINPVHPYAWGLFKTTLLKAMKNREDLHIWSPEIFHGDKVCHHCKGEGKNEVPKDHPTYIEAVDDSARNPEMYGDFKYGDPLWFHCSPCQGSGILTKLDQYREEKRNEVPVRPADIR